MMNWKSMAALALSAALALTALGGCSAKGDGSTSADGSSSVEPMDLSKVTDPYLATAGLSADTVVATAGDHEITAGNVLYWLSYTADSASYYYSMMGMSDLPWDTETDGQTMEEAFLDGALKTAAMYTLIPGIAQEHGLSLSDQEKQEGEDALSSMLSDAGSQQLMDHMMWSSALTAPLYTQFYQANLLNDKLMDALCGEGTEGYPTDDQVLTYAQDSLGIAYRVKHILLKTVDTSSPLTDENGNATGEYTPLDDETVAQKKAQAEDILAQLQAADDKQALFDQLMEEYSEDSPSGFEGMDAALGDMVEPFETAALALEPGEISGIVESPYGYHIILRLPLEADSYREDYIAYLMGQQQQAWLDENPIQTNENFDKIDPSAYYNQLLSLRAAVEEEAAALQEDASTGDSSTGDSSTGDASTADTSGAASSSQG